MAADKPRLLLETLRSLTVNQKREQSSGITLRMAQSLLIVLMQHHNMQSDQTSYSSTPLCLLTQSWPSISIIKTFITLLYLCIVLLHCAYVDLRRQRPNLVTGLP